MKWMLGTTLALAMGLSAVPRAQSGDGMGKPMKDDKMAAVTYTGCVESAPAGGLLLTHVDSGQHMSMKGKDMAMKSKDTSMNDMKDDHMMSASVRLVGSSSLDKHLGQ